MDTIKCYSDASFDPGSKTAVIGWRINRENIRINTLSNTNNTRAEIIGLINLISELDPTLNYIIYTDCQSIINRIACFDKLIQKNFTNNRGTELANVDIYKKLFGLLTPNIRLIHIDGHSPANQKNEDDKLFSELDRCVRKELRKIRKVVE